MKEAKPPARILISCQMKEEINKNMMLMHQVICTDKVLFELNAKRAHIYSLAKHTVILKNGQAETIYIDQSNNNLLIKIEDMIEQRTKQIERFYRFYI